MTNLPAIIAYQGVPGAYSHLACRKAYPELEAKACISFSDAMFMVEGGKARLAMIPLENSTAGRVEEIYRLIPKTRLHILGEHFEPVKHCLLAKQGAILEDINSVASHPQALAQCSNNIDNLGLKPVASLDTAGAAAELAGSNSNNKAAIASSLAAELYGLDILNKNFQDIDGNTTRFLILARDNQMPSFCSNTRFMTSIMFTVRNIPAALYKALGGFSTNGLNMLKLESYMASDTMHVTSFHLDVEGHPEQKSMQYALQELNFFTHEVRIMGTYPWHPFRIENEGAIE